jgi:fatty acid desaturase
LNDLFGNIASMVVILPFYPWRYIHADHHVWVGYQDLDPTMGQINPRQVKPLQKAIVDACWRYWIPVFALSFSFGNFWNMSKLFRRWKKPSILASSGAL